MSKLARIAAGGLVFLGVVHTAGTTGSYPLDAPEALWFAGTGIMLIAAGLLTYAATMPEARIARITSIVVNLLGLTLACLALPVLHEPQVYLVIAFFVAALMGVSVIMFKSQN